MRKLPWLKFYPNDWLSDEALTSCSLAAQGLWIRMLCLMHKSDRRGYLSVGGQIPTPEQLSRMLGISQGELSPLLTELVTSGVTSVSEHGCYFNRRMAQEQKKCELCSHAGKRGGGNPTFKGGPKGRNKGQPKGRSKLRSSIWPLASGSSSFTEEECLKIYKAYPRQVGHGAAVRAIGKALERLKAKGQIDDVHSWLLGIVQCYAKARADQEAKFTPYCATWMNQERYLDEPKDWQSQGANSTSDPERTGRYKNVGRRIKT